MQKKKKKKKKNKKNRKNWKNRHRVNSLSCYLPKHRFDKKYRTAQDDRFEDFFSQLTRISNDSTLAILVNIYIDELPTKCISLKSVNQLIDGSLLLLAERPRFQCEAKDELLEYEKWLKYPSDVADNPVKDIIMPNILCTLLLETMYRSPPDQTLTLMQVMTKYYNTKDSICKEQCECGECDKYDICPKPDSSKISRYPLQDFPEVIKEWLGIVKAQSGSYEIKPLFTNLVAALVDSQGDLPFRNSSRATNWTQNDSLLTNCLSAIITDHKEKPDAFVSYYLMEVIFRLNTKRQLFLASIGGKKRVKSNSELLSPQALADFFFSSLLVYIPDKYISNCVYSREHLHALMQLSYYWIPAMLTILRYYFETAGKFDYESIKKFLLPICSEIELPKRVNLTDRETRNYNKSWTSFAPPYGYRKKKSYHIYRIDEWKKRTLPKSWTEYDRKMLESIQNILQ